MILEVAGVFLLFKNLENVNLNIKFFSNPNGIFRKSVFSLAKYSYGFYLLHYPILVVMVLFLKTYTNLNFKLLFLVSFVVIIGICWIIRALLNRVPYINKIIGSK